MHVFIDFIFMLFLLNTYIYIYIIFSIFTVSYALVIHCNNCHANKAHIELNLEREREVYYPS